MTNQLSNPVFQDADKARAWLEAALWPQGPVCGHCGTLGQSTPLETRPGWYQCNACRKQFSVTVGTLFERSHIPLNKWLLAAFLLCASKKGMSTHQMHRMIGVSYKSTWFMMHRLREAMRDGKMPPLGGEGETVEIDETYVGGKEKNKHQNKRTPKAKGTMGKEAVFALVERSGSVRSFHVPEVSGYILADVLDAHLHGKTLVYSDANHTTRFAAKAFKSEAVNHKIGEYVRGDVHTNTIEGYFSILKRGIIGTYHHVSQQHLKRYLAEFDFRYNERMGLGVSDTERTEKALKGIVGKRLTYRRAGERAHV